MANTLKIRKDGHYLNGLRVESGMTLDLALADNNWVTGRFEWSGCSTDLPQFVITMNLWQPIEESPEVGIDLPPSVQLWWPNERELATKYPHGAVITFHDPQGLTTGIDGALAKGFVNGTPMHDPETGTIYIPVYCNRKDGQEPTTIMANEQNVKSVELPSSG